MPFFVFVFNIYSLVHSKEPKVCVNGQNKLGIGFIVYLHHQLLSYLFWYIYRCVPRFMENYFE